MTVVAPPIVQPPPCRLGVFGLGPRGWHHLERLRVSDEAVVVAVTDASLTLRDQARKSDWPVVDTTEALLATKGLEGVLVASPPEERGPIILQSLRAGLNVCVEPPLAEDLSLARQWLALADRLHKRLSLVPWSRWDPQFERALAAVASGRLGAVQAARLTVAEWSPLVNPPPDRLSDAGLPEQQFGPQGFDQLLQLVTSDPALIWARRLTDEDGFLTVIDFADGSFAEIDFRRRSRTGQTTGWVLEGARSSYRGGRLITVSAEGELCDEPVEAATPGQPSEWRSMFTPSPSPARDAGHGRLWQTIGLARAVTLACQRHSPVRWDEIVGS